MNETIEVEGLTLAARVFGPEDGIPTLALHGWLDNANSFVPLAEHLPELRIVALDLPGHGRSDHRGSDASYHFVDAVAIVAQALDRLEWDRCVLLGHSMGAGICALLGGTWPERFGAIAFLDGLGPLSETVEMTPTRLANAIADEEKRRARAANRKRKRAFASREEAIERLVDVQRVGQHAAELLCERGLVEADGAFEWAADPRLRLPSRLRFTEAQVLRFLSRIRSPSVLIRAKDGWPANEAMMRIRVETTPELEVVEVPGGHHVHMDEPETVAPHVRALLGRMEGEP